MKKQAHGLPFRSLDEEIAHSVITLQTEPEKDTPFLLSNHGLTWQICSQNSIETLVWKMTSASTHVDAYHSKSEQQD
jgi:hypothetical protein